MATSYLPLLLLLQHVKSVKVPDAVLPSVPTDSTEALHADRVALPL